MEAKHLLHHVLYHIFIPFTLPGNAPYATHLYGFLYHAGWTCNPFRGIQLTLGANVRNCTPGCNFLPALLRIIYTFPTAPVARPGYSPYLCARMEMSIDNYREAVLRYLRRTGAGHLSARAGLFDMDGVLFDSMPAHAGAWERVMRRHGIPFTLRDGYLNEGRVGSATIRGASLARCGRDVSTEEIRCIYAEKSRAFNTFPPAVPMPGAAELLRQIAADGLFAVLVTGSGQRSLLGKLQAAYPGVFHPERMVTAFDVRHGKPSPEPYLIGLQKGGVEAHEAFIVENAPLGVAAGYAAGVFTIAVNTGPIPPETLHKVGADLVFPSMQALASAWPALLKTFRTVHT